MYANRFRAGTSTDGAAISRDARTPGKRTRTELLPVRREGGAPLPDELRGRLESALGADLGGVSVHTGSESAESAEAMDANAYATGNEIHFAAGRYAPG